jgi:glycolate oxidase iron-sulfur subunit
MNDLKDLSTKASQCVKCGTCMANCPIYIETLSEVTTPRGKLSLIESLASGEIELSKRLQDILFSCLACDTCEESCPNNVKVGEILLAARKELVNHRGLSTVKRLFFRHVLSSLRAMPLYLRSGSLLQGLLLKKIPGGSGLHLRFPLPFLDKKRLIPALAKNFFCDYQPLLAKAHPEKKRVGFFVGCVNNYLFPRIGETTVRLLTRNEVSVITPSDQNCCGLMAFGAGDWSSAQKCALSNIAAFETHNLETIITSCASCAATLKTFYPQMFKDADTGTQKRVKRFSNSITDISHFLTQELDSTSALHKKLHQQKNLPTITYHDPCHLKRTLGISQEPRELLQSLSHLEFVEMDDASKCCGMGGTFTITHYDLSMNILNHKLDSLEAMEVDMLATGCSGCLLQFMDGIHQRGLKTKVVHLVEALESGQDHEIGDR